MTNINPDTINLNKVGTGGKNSDRIMKMLIKTRTVDAPGQRCDVGEDSGPVQINLRMVDDDGDELVNSAKTIVCNHGPQGSTRDVLVQSPVNCAGSVVPDGYSSGVITATGTGSPGTPDYVEELTINCTE